MDQTLEIFISSAPKDEKLLDTLLKALEGSLQPLKQQGLIRFWHERDIKPGAIIKQERQKHLETARIFLLLISINFMNLPFCYSEEMQELMRRHRAGEIHIIPILLSEAAWDTAPFGTLRALPDNDQAVSSWNRKDRAWLNIAKGVKRIIEEFISSAATYASVAEENLSVTKESLNPSSQHALRKSSSAFTDGEQHTTNEGSTQVPLMPEQIYDGVVCYWGLLVGVGEYEDTNYPPLLTCVDDAKAVARQLTHCGYNANNMRLLIDRKGIDGDPLIQELAGDNDQLGKPTKGNIIEALYTLAERTRPEDLLLFYYTGHGNQKDQESYLVAHDGRRNTPEHTAVPISTIKKIMLQAKAQKKVIILDTCRAETIPGSMATPQPMSPAFIERVFEQAKGLVILTSCDAGEHSYVWEEQQCSVFTYFLLQALRSGKADFNGKERISASDAYKYVLDRVKRWAMQNNRVQNPGITTDGQGDIIVAYYQQEPLTVDQMLPENRSATIVPSRIGALSWKELQAITIQGESYLFERATVREPSTSDDGTTLREAQVRHIGTDLPLCLKQVHMVGPTGDGLKLQKILKRERQILLELEEEGCRDFPRIFPLIDSDAEKDFTFAYIPTNGTDLLQVFEGQNKPRDISSIKQLLQSVLPLCEALSVLHKKKLSHRRLSLDTLVLLRGQYMMVQDIGLAAWAPRKGENLDKDFLAPEQEKTNSEITVLPGPATDIYQLGVILHSLITGQIFSPGSVASFYNQAVSAQLSETIRRAVTRQPIERWSTIEEFIAALRLSNQ